MYNSVKRYDSTNKNKTNVVEFPFIEKMIYNYINQINKKTKEQKNPNNFLGTFPKGMILFPINTHYDEYGKIIF